MYQVIMAQNWGSGDAITKEHRFDNAAQLAAWFKDAISPMWQRRRAFVKIGGAWHIVTNYEQAGNPESAPLVTPQFGHAYTALQNL